MSAMDSKPLVSIGIPVYNEERFLARALDSLLTQDYEHFEIIICDNASTDHTLEIAREYAEKDDRIQVHSAPENKGAIWNFNRAFHLGHGKYFMWAAADDLWHPTFISKCVRILEEDPNVVLAYPRGAIVDDEGKEYAIWGYADTRDCNSPTQRFVLHLLGLTEIGNIIYGVIRADALRRTKLFRHTLGSDLVLLGELALHGSFANVDEVLFFRRRIRQGEDMRKRHNRWRAQVVPNRIWFPYLRILPAYLNVAWHAPVNLRRKLMLCVAVLAFVPWRYRSVMLKP